MLFLAPGVSNGMLTNPSAAGMDIREVRVAIYTSVIEDYVIEVEQALDYAWEENGTYYKISSSIIGREQVNGRETPSLNGDAFDVLIIPGSGRPYVDAADPWWRSAVRDFVADGGGYVGICGGANIASMGFRENWSINAVLNLSTLGIANVYVNDNQREEWQYLWKSNWEEGMPPIDVAIARSDNPIFAGFFGERRSMRYGGGPGMYPTTVPCEECGKVTPLAVYAEEPMEVAPLHFWRWRNGWEIMATISTDVKGQYAAVATSYGKGNVVLFGPHPEKPIWFGGHVEEFPVRPNAGPFTWFIYNWSNATLSLPSYNWWMLRRAVAWAADASLPQVMYGGATAISGSLLSVNGHVVLPLPSGVLIGSVRRGV